MTKKFRIWDHQLKLFWIGSIREIFGHLSADISDNQIQQYTGLTDSQGVEIYEGDFVKAGAIKGKINFYKSAYYINEQLLIDVYVLLAGNIKIIGNIFQTPELLEKC